MQSVEREAGGVEREAEDGERGAGGVEREDECVEREEEAVEVAAEGGMAPEKAPNEANLVSTQNSQRKGVESETRGSAKRERSHITAGGNGRDMGSGERVEQGEVILRRGSRDANGDARQRSGCPPWQPQPSEGANRGEPGIAAWRHVEPESQKNGYFSVPFFAAWGLVGWERSWELYENGRRRQGRIVVHRPGVFPGSKEITSPCHGHAHSLPCQAGEGLEP